MPAKAVPPILRLHRFSRSQEPRPWASTYETSAEETDDGAVRPGWDALRARAQAELLQLLTERVDYDGVGAAHRAAFDALVAALLKHETLEKA